MSVLIGLHTEWLYAPKSVASIAFTVVALITAGFIFFDLWTQHLMPQRFRRAMGALAAFLTVMGGFAMARFYDSLIDLAQLHEHPNIVTTLSQQHAWFIETPLLVATVILFAFLLLLNSAYYHHNKPVDPPKLPKTCYPPN